MMSCDAGAGVCFFFSNMYVHIPDHLSFNEGKRLVRPWKKSENPPPPPPPLTSPQSVLVLNTRAQQHLERNVLTTLRGGLADDTTHFKQSDTQMEVE